MFATAQALAFATAKKLDMFVSAFIITVSEV